MYVEIANLFLFLISLNMDQDLLSSQIERMKANASARPKSSGINDEDILDESGLNAANTPIGNAAAVPVGIVDTS